MCEDRRLLVGDEDIRRGEPKGEKNKKKLTIGSYVSVANPTFVVLGPNRKRIRHISSQPNRERDHPVPGT
jgi:hypothetical protein